MREYEENKIATLHHHVLRTVELIGQNPEADEATLVECLSAFGYQRLQAEVLVAFVPLGLARAVIRRLQAVTPIKLSDHVLVLQGDRQFEIELMHVPEFVAALRLGEETFTTGIIPKESLTQTILLSVELKLINQVFNSGTTISEIAAPILLRLGDVPGFENWYSQLTP